MLSVLGLALSGMIGFPQLRVLINIPAFRLDVVVADSVERSIPIAVGMPAFPTPRGSFVIASVDWNPSWNPPDHPWAAQQRPMPPGPQNPMGRVKLNFRPLYFVHGTPLASSIGSAASHGCVRMNNTDALQLARIVQQFGSPKLTAAEIDRLATDTVRMRTVALDRPVPLEITYDLVELRGGELTVYRDIYHLARRSMRAEIYALLAARGIDTTLLDSTRVESLVHSIPPEGSRAALDSLVYTPSPDRRRPRPTARYSADAATPMDDTGRCTAP